MVPLIKEETINIVPKSKYLNPAELVANRNSFSENKQKTGFAEETKCEKDLLVSLYGELRKCLSVPRIDRFGGRTLAIWDNEEHLAKVQRKEGKLETFGTTINNVFCLNYCETLYLLEMGRLQLEFKFNILSIEEAYLLLLGEGPSYKYSEYLVYSYLTRAGYILTMHKNIVVYKRKTEQASEQAKATETDCVWAWLSNTVQRKPIPAFIKKSKLFANVKIQLALIKASIIEQRQKTENIAIDISDSESDIETPPAKKTKLANTNSNDKNWNQTAISSNVKSFLDFLMDDPEYKKFADIFKKFDIIKSKTSTTRLDFNDDIVDEEAFKNKSDLCLNFDLFLHNNGFKKTGSNSPLMRVLVLPASQTFPCHSEISAYHRELLFSTPILVVSVGDAKQIQAFLYFFT